jgi:site-specific DNA-methyltransferase (adenine-specific)
MSLRDYLFHEEPGITLYCGDCREVLPLLRCPNTSYCIEACDGRCQPTLLVTDPPYGIGHPTDFHARGRDALAACRDYPPVVGDAEPFDPAWLLALNLPTVLWGANHYASRLPDASGWLVWDKERPDDLDQATCELAWTNYVKGVRRFRWLWNGMMRAGKDELGHPTQKPLALMKWCLGLRWTPEGTVLDPYMGSGTTIEAAKLMGRRAIGIEIEPKYCEIAVKRLRQEVLL